MVEWFVHTSWKFFAVSLAVAAASALLGFGDHGVGGYVISIAASAALAASIAGGYLHGRRLCTRCAGEFPLDAPGEAARRRGSLKMFHRMSKWALPVIAVFLLAQLASIPVGGGQVADLSFGLYAAWAIGFAMVTARHGRLRLWCPWCGHGGRGGGGGEEGGAPPAGGRGLRPTSTGT